MARIRNIKPEFFRHEKLQSLGPIPMLVFAGLWCQCDKAGNFQWRPSQLKLDILPFIDFDFGSTLEALRKSGEVIAYSGLDGKPYGHIPTFIEHQRFFGSEAKSKPRFPSFLEGKECLEFPSNFQGSNLDRGSWKLEVGNKEVGERKKFQKPTLEELTTFIADKGYEVDPVKWLAHYESNGWMVGKNKMKSWRAAVVTWSKNNFGTGRQKTGVEALRA